MRLTASVLRACGGVDAGTLLGSDGLGFGDVAATCQQLGAPPPDSGASLASCIAAAYGCAAGSVVRRVLPAIDGELARVGLALGDEFACPTIEATPTPTPSPGTTGTPTVIATPTVTPTTPPVTLLVPGGGGSSSDCVMEWAIRSAPLDPPPLTTVRCTDGDPACDTDGLVNDVCVFAVGICLGGTDPQLPSCPAAAGITSFTLQGPQTDPADPGNAELVLQVVSDLVGVEPGGSHHNVFTFDPPLALVPPSHCSAPAAVTVERRGLDRRTQRFRARTIGFAGGGGSADDSDSLYLTCTVD